MKIIKYLFILLATFIVIGVFFVRRGFGRAEVVLPSKSEPILETLSNEEGEVVVTVTPKMLAQDFWSFEVVLDTHSVELDYDLQAASFLVDEAGGEHQAVSWEGDPSGGHHRKGILMFDSLSKAESKFQLKVKNVGFAPERVFVWKLF